MKKIGLMIIAAMLCIIFGGCGEEVVLQYKALNNGTDCAIIGVDDKTVDKLVIPAEINGLRVTQIEWGAFSNCTELKSVELPDTLEVIGPAAFSGCVKLKSVELPESLLSIGSATFGYCEALKDIELPDSLEVIESSAFGYCTALDRIVIPKSIKEIKTNTFLECTSLKSVEMSEGVEIINSNAFSKCTSLEKVKTPNSLKEIRDRAFFDCAGLKSIEISAEVEYVSHSAFEACLAIENINVDIGNVKYTSRDANGKEVNVLMSAGGMLIETGKEAVIPEGTIDIDRFAFDSHLDITSITVPDTVVWYGVATALQDCPNLTTVYGKAGSGAEEWANRRGINFVAIEDANK